MKIVGNMIRAKRKEAGLSQKELAKHLKCTQSTISQIEKGQLNPTVDFLERLAHFFDLPPGYFLVDDEMALPEEGYFYAQDSLLYLEELYEHDLFDAVLEEVEKCVSSAAFQHDRHFAHLMLIKAKTLTRIDQTKQSLDLSLYLLEEYRSQFSSFHLAELLINLAFVYLQMSLQLTPLKKEVLDTRSNESTEFLLKAKEFTEQAQRLVEIRFKRTNLYKEILFLKGVIAIRFGEKKESERFFSLLHQIYEREFKKYKDSYTLIERLYTNATQSPNEKTPFSMAELFKGE